MKKELIRWKVTPIAGFCRLMYIQAMAWLHNIDFLRKLIYIDYCRDIGNKCVVLPQWTEIKGEWSYLSGQTQKVRGPALVDNFKSNRSKVQDAITEANEIASGKRETKAYKNANEMIRDILDK
jgi:hypothetical protein